jgi:phosphoribosylanthranilate isomerase
MGVDALGVIGVAGSPRYVPAEHRNALFLAASAASATCAGVLVVADPSDADLAELDPRWGHQVVQLHGGESPERCHDLRQRLSCRIWKALRIRGPGDLAAAAAYGGAVDALLLDAWVPEQLGGTGHRIPIEWLEGWQPTLPWWLAGGIRADRVGPVLARLSPHGLDASSGVERAPGDKDLALVGQLVAAVRSSSEDQGAVS